MWADVVLCCDKRVKCLLSEGDKFHIVIVPGISEGSQVIPSETHSFCCVLSVAVKSHLPQAMLELAKLILTFLICMFVCMGAAERLSSDIFFHSKSFLLSGAVRCLYLCFLLSIS